MHVNNNKKLIPIIILVLAAGGVGFWYWSQKRAEVSETPAGTLAATEVRDGLGAEAFNKTNNPLSNVLPETNPFYVDTNPFK